MDKRKTYLLVVDTETCNGRTVNDKPDLSDSLVYDLGFAIVDKKGEVYETRSFVIRDVFYDMKDTMSSAYYAEKIPTYKKDLAAKKRKLVSFYEARKAMLDLMKEYNVSAVVAHNANFDVNALNKTERYLTKSKYRWFLPYNTEVWDTLKMARQTIGKQKSYIAFCETNGYMTKHSVPRVRLTAEILYKYLTGNNDFEEEHTGLEDVLIEKEILVQCLKQHKKIEMTI